MDRQNEREEDDQSIADMEYVLKAEQDSVQLLQESNERAARILSEARAEAAAIAQHADARIARLHSSYLNKVERDIVRLAEANASIARLPRESYAPAMLAQAARRVAAKLTDQT